MLHRHDANHLGQAAAVEHAIGAPSSREEKTTHILAQMKQQLLSAGHVYFTRYINATSTASPMLIVPTCRAVLHDAAHGCVTVDHDPQSGAVFIEFERLESDDLILPNYRVTLSTEHVLAWIESLLARIGRTCRRLDPGAGRRSLNRVLRLTEQERDEVYLSSHGAHVVLVRGGCVLKVPFVLEPMAEFWPRLREEQEEGSDGCTTASDFAAFVKSMMIPP